jgi:hypothetical protein
MNVRELIDALGAGDLDAEVYVAVDGPQGPRPLGYIDECFRPRRSRLVLCPLEAEERGGPSASPGGETAEAGAPPALISDSALPLVRVGQGGFAKDYPG